MFWVIDDVIYVTIIITIIIIIIIIDCPPIDHN